MEVVQKFEVAVLAGIARERRAPEDRPIAVPAGDEGGLELGMGGAEIAGIGKLGIRQLFLQRRVAIAAETLGGRRHLGRALMLGMAFDAAAGRDVERFLEGELDLAPGGEARLGARQAERVGVVVDAGVANPCRRRRSPPRTPLRGKPGSRSRGRYGRATICRWTTYHRHESARLPLSPVAGRYSP